MADSPTPDSRRRRLAGHAIALLGAALFAIPLYDVWDDTTDLGWGILPSLVENVTLFALAALLVAGGVWLARSESDSDHATTVMSTTFGGTVATAALFAWIVAVQTWTMNDLKPYVIALDAVVVGALGSFGIGVYRARSDSRRRDLQVERNRLAGLFENTSDAVATVELADGSPTVSSANEHFRETFDDPEAAIQEAAQLAGTSLSSLFDGDHRGEPTTQEIAYSEANGVHEVAYGDRDDSDAREFIVQFVPYDTDRGRTYVYVVATDVTEQKQLAREREANERLDLLHEYASKLVNAQNRDRAAALAREAVEELYAPSDVRVVLDGEVVAGPDNSNSTFNTVAKVGDRGRIELAAHLATRELNAVNVLATHLDDVLDRLDYERELAIEREELDFINRTLRHNLLNDIQVVKARLQTLDDGDDLLNHRDVLLDHLDRMAEFVQTMRTYTKSLVEDDEHVLHPVDLRPALEDVADGTRNAYEDAVVSLGDIPHVAVSADELLEPVLENVLTNAVEHNDKATPRIHVDAERHGDWVTVRVADNGPGISDDRKEAVFERGELGEHSSGSGFGLFLVRKTVESYGGGVEIKDNEPTGTVVRITLPVAST
ncbi:HAMP domain-containing histidine kinase [Halobacterium sp. KA-4]|uniref:sensor histidine kinase n=1 Tax=Halobacterium sp. KA-4 TaxID=2896367 RepID=UPI001E4A7625|nr:HAMP domain-containing sensor histidine kinase [Halobacterium sp. KA-4]MCD2200419.1 HAMP domain-containing histidine kinase [Halobacterium sp. KA-4]